MNRHERRWEAELMRAKRWVVGVIVLVAAGTVVVAARLMKHGLPYDEAKVHKGEFRETVEATGSLEAAVAFEIGPPSARDIWQYNLSWMIPEGTYVKKGDVIARFDTTDLDDELRRHHASLETTLQTREKEERNLEVSLRQLKLDLVKAEGSLKKLEVSLAVPQELVSSIEIQQLRLERELAQRRRDFLSQKIGFEQDLVKSKLELLDAKKEFYETKISYSEETKEKFNVKAPVGGLVVYIPKGNGDRWEVGEGIWMLAKFLKIADISTLQVETYVLEVDSARIAVGQASEVRVDAMPGLVLRSPISEIGRMVHEKSVQDPSKVFDAIMPLDPQKHQLEGLRPGMGVQVVIETNKLADRLTIPLDAVHSDGEETWVEVIENGSFVKRVVKLGPRNTDRVVVESGLEEGETVTSGRTAGGRA